MGKIKYLAVTIVSAIIIMLIFTITPTKAKYIYSYNLESNLDIGYPIFNITKEQNNETFDFNNEIIFNLKINNFNENDIVSAVGGNYYIKILDSNKNELNIEDAFVESVPYSSYLKDKDGNIVDSHGNILDEEGNVIQQRELSEDELATIVEIRKGFGNIVLKSDGMSKEEKELVIKLTLEDKDAASFKFFVYVYIENPNTLAITKYKEYEYTITNTNDEIDIYGETDSNTDATQNSLDVNDEILSNQVDIYDEKTSDQVDIYD